MSQYPIYDLCVIGGGINGTGIARDAAGRGLSVLLLEAEDLASATSSASTKLIHGGLRYLEYYEFKLVTEALRERERLLNAAPHIIWPLEFILPHAPHLRPAWMIRAGLFLYDWLGKRKKLPASKSIDFKTHISGVPLNAKYTRGFSYADCWVEDSRMVVLNAVDAAAKGAAILTRTKCTSLTPTQNQRHWSIGTEDQTYTARAVVNAAGPWVRGFLDAQHLSASTTPQMRLIKGSHIIVPQLYSGSHAYILQQSDGRIVFTIPYEGAYTLIGTTDVPYEGDPRYATISEEEKAYLCHAVNDSFTAQISVDDIIWHYSGVRPLMDSGDDNAAAITRDYKLELEHSFGPPLLSIFGGKLTTYRRLSEDAVNILRPFFLNMKEAWTACSAMPGGDISGGEFEKFVHQKKLQYNQISTDVIQRLCRAYGTEIDAMLQSGEGENFGDGIYAAEIKYLVEREWARSIDDILWRRSKLGLHISHSTKERLEAVFPKILQESISA